MLLLVINIAGPLLTWSLVRVNHQLNQSKMELTAAVEKLRITATDLRDSRAAAQDWASENEQLARVAEQARLATRRQLYSADSSNASYANRSADQYARLIGYLDRWAAEASDPRDWEYYWIQSLVRLPSLEFDFQQTHGGSFSGMLSVDWSPDNQHIATGSTMRVVEKFDTLTGQREWVSESFGSIAAVDWNDQGDWIAAGTDDGLLCIIDAESGNTRRTFRAHSSLHDLKCSRDGRLLASCGDGQIKVWNTAEKQWNKLGENWRVDDAGAWNSQGTQIALGLRSTDIAVSSFSPEAMQLSKPQRIPAAHGKAVSSIAWSPTGRRSVFMADDDLRWNGSTHEQDSSPGSAQGTEPGNVTRPSRRQMSISSR